MIQLQRHHATGADYRADIDGLRAIAVLSVMAFHFGGLLPGGFTGVDVFFVISGYLITSQLAQEIHEGTFGLLGFYYRRIRRIVPALVVMLAVTLAAGKFLLMPGDYMALGASAAAAAFGASNFFFLTHTDYFAQAADLMPLLHTWSLAVEEQFYLVWPLLLLLLVAGRKRLDVAAAIGALVIIGFGASLVWMDSDPKAAFFMAVPRAWELAIGALLVFLPRLPASLRGASVVGLALIIAGFALIRSTSFPGLPALLPCVGAALVIWPKERPAGIDRWLGLLRPLGLISYSLYLWHWPVWVLYRMYINSGKPLVYEAIALAAVSILLAVISWRFVEQPFRRLRLPPAKTVQAGLAACMAIFCAGQFIHSEEGEPERVPEAYAMRSLEAMWEWPCPKQDAMPPLAATYCFFGKPWKTASRKVLVWGDSHAGHFAPIIEAAAKEQPDAFLLYQGCPAVFGGHVNRVDPTIPDYAAQCRSERENAIKLLANDPDIKLVILASSWGYLPRLTSQDGTLPGDDKLDWFASGLTDLIERTQSDGRKFLIIGMVPQHQVDPTPCAYAQSSLWRAPCRETEADRRTMRELSQATDRVFLKIAADHPNVETVIPRDALCDAAGCKSNLNGEFLYRDGGHIRRNLSEGTRRKLADLIGLTAALERRPPSRVEATAKGASN
ncbi:acyltransferase family protein [Bradyrhizobium elkanii]|uniref:Peptidoglycan/LPS O-acetylase OafA/YrhL n=1 Tax=Bradyrhizobium elkanii TaxID=29448 RepID=A0A8I1YD71_BRAEL|nr:acyltransferase family protein [Bradyrhizobium elkanii]MBP1296610.1 peptidoglycan/LPS O-acetylase OafA/YrhL [Bradyrhizobium elkanii]